MTEQAALVNLVVEMIETLKTPHAAALGAALAFALAWAGSRANK